MKTASNSRGGAGGEGGYEGGGAAFFAIYDPKRYPAFDNAAFAADPADTGRQLGGGASDPGKPRRSGLPYVRFHLPEGSQQQPPSSAPGTSLEGQARQQQQLPEDDNLDENSVLQEANPVPDAPVAAAAATATTTELRKAGSVSGRWSAAAVAVVAPERRPTLLRLAEAAAAKRDLDSKGSVNGGGATEAGKTELAELLARGLQRQREVKSLQASGSSQQHQQQSLQQRQATWAGWRSAIAEHLVSRAGHHYFNGERDPAAVSRASIRGSLIAYRRGPRPDVISHFEQHQHQPQQSPQGQQPQQLFRRGDSMRQSARM